MLVFWSALSALGYAGPPTCGTLELFEPVEPPVEFPVVYGLDLQQRDAYHAPNVMLGEHVAVRWGDDTFLDPADIQGVVDLFETAWEFEFGVMGHSVPHRSDEYYFNVYIGDTGEGIPPGHGHGGYYISDSERWPMIVVAEATVASSDLRTVVAHELYHAAQSAEGSFPRSSINANSWYWEATASWVVPLVFPDDARHAQRLYSYAMLPHFRLDHFGQPGTGGLAESYSYGAFIFAAHLQDVTGGWEIIRDSWRDDRGAPSAVETLRILLDERGVDFDEVWLDHIARTATWDYPQGDVYRDTLLARLGPDQHLGLVAGELPALGSEDWRTVEAELLPRQYGYNILRLGEPEVGTYTVDLRADGTNEMGRAARFGARLVVVRSDGTVTYTPFDSFDREASVQTQVGRDVSEIIVVVGAWTEQALFPTSQETFPYSYRVGFSRENIDSNPETGGCGCAGAGDGGPWLLGLPGLVLVARRRRRA